MKALQQDTITHAHRFGIRGSVGKALYYTLTVACAATAFHARSDTLATSDSVGLHWNEIGRAEQALNVAESRRSPEPTPSSSIWPPSSQAAEA